MKTNPVFTVKKKRGKRHASVISFSDNLRTGVVGQPPMVFSGVQAFEGDEGGAQSSSHVGVRGDHNRETAHGFEGFHKP